jgi:hypothetical protein
MKRLANGLLVAISLAVKQLPDFLRDALGVVGAGLIAYGAWLISPACGYIVGGILLLIGSILSALAPTDRK